MNLVRGNWEIVATFHGDKTYEGRLFGLALWAKIKDVGVLRECRIGGERHGLFPCLVARDESIASALSVYSGYEIAVGDGRSFFTRKDALECYRTLAKAGVPVTHECLVWAVSELPYDSPKPKQPDQPSIAQQHAEAPF